MKQVKITEEEAKLMHNTGVNRLKDIAESAFPVLFQKQNKWSDFGDIDGYYISSSSDIFYVNTLSNNYTKNIYPTKKEAEMGLAMAQLLQWRDRANEDLIDDWCDWNDEDQLKYGIYRDGDEIEDCVYTTSFDHLVFKTKTVVQQFKKDHKTLIRKAFGL